MATNNFATLYQLRSNKITRVLIYAFLEWTLISLLLINSLFSLLIHKFAIFFGLKPPCIFCSRLDNYFQQTQKEDIICEQHAVEISRIGYCSNHRKLVVESQSLCLDCDCSSSSVIVDDIRVSVKRCCCCDGIIKLSSLDRDSDDLVINQRGLLGFDSDLKSGYEILNDYDDDDDDDDDDDEKKEEEEKEPLLKNVEEDEDHEDDINNKEIVFRDRINNNLCPDMLPQHLEFYINHDDYRLIPVDLVNSNEVIFRGEEDSKEFELVLEGDELLCGFKFIRKENLPSIQEEEDEEKEEGNMVISHPYENESLIQEGNSATFQEQEEEKKEIEERNFADLVEYEEEEEEKMVISQPHIEENKIEERSLASSLSDAKQTEEGEKIIEQTLKTELGLSQNHESIQKTEESINGGTSMTIENLKSELEIERNTLKALYKELEEERNASAIAANQTMAMINRLQEEKSTIQMEALQYQRILEEQSEYDQEALQMMNELMVKREREKQELEREVEVLRKKVLYRKKEGRNSSASLSYGEESDELSIDLNVEESGDHGDTPIETIVGMQETLTCFEDERQAILEQLKGLEEKLFNLVEEEEEKEEENLENIENTKTMLNGSMQKRLLPLFDATEFVEQEEDEEEEFEFEKKRISIQDEFDVVYERLQALEADREFLKHCIGSLRKGDKGLDLLQEILQHLRDLKCVEVQAMKSIDHYGSV